MRGQRAAAVMIATPAWLHAAGQEACYRTKGKANHSASNCTALTRWPRVMPWLHTLSHQLHHVRWACFLQLLSRINFPGVDSCAQVGPASDLQCMYTDGDFVVETPWELADLPGAGWIEGMVLLLMFVILRVAALLVIRVRMEVGRKKTIWG